MVTNLLDISKGHFTDIAIAKAAVFLGENNAATYKAINFILPILLGGLANKTSSAEGVNILMQHLKENNKIDMSGNLGTLIGGGSQTQNLISQGAAIVNSVFDKRSGQISDWIATNTHIKSASATNLMNIVAPILINLIEKRSGSSANSFVGLLNEQLPFLRNADLPASLVNVAKLDFTTPVTTKVDEVVERNMDFSKFIPWLVIGAVLIGCYFLYKTYGATGTETPKETVVKADTAKQKATTVDSAATAIGGIHKLMLPEGEIEIPKGSFLDKLYTAVTDAKADLTKPLTLDSVYFKNAYARLTPESKNQVDELVKIMRAFPTVEIKIDGHTDNFGIPDKNLRLSIFRAASVKRYLTMNGILSQRIDTQGFGDTKPIADNATPEGMAKNRRIEVYVVKK